MLEKYIPRFNLKHCLGMLLLIVSTQALSFDFLNKKYDIYICNTDGKNCKKESSQISFKVDAKKSIVIMTAYENGVFDSSKALDKCKVIDAKNWECTYTYTSSFGNVHWLYTMSNGRLSNDVPTVRFK
jgi:hypothetical protein